jgi:hypothetical protein
MTFKQIIGDHYYYYFRANGALIELYITDYWDNAKIKLIGRDQRIIIDNNLYRQ